MEKECECYEEKVQPYQKNDYKPIIYIISCCCLPTPMTLAIGRESDVPACGPPASFSVHLANSAVIPAGSVQKSRGDSVVRMWVLQRGYRGDGCDLA